jgi:hypothetical protein
MVIIAGEALPMIAVRAAAQEADMPMRKVLHYLVLAAGITPLGCGTMANIEGRKLPAQGRPGEVVTTPFGGIRRDIEWAQSTDSPEKLRYVADLPLSFFGDLVTLPKTVIGTHSDTLLESYDANQTAALYGATAASPSAH